MKREKIEFDGWDDPNFFPVPQILSDTFLPDLSLAELKILIYLFRRTLGFRKQSDSISISQISDGIKTDDGRLVDRGTGLSKKPILRALRALEQKGMISRERVSDANQGNKPTKYTLRFKEDPPTTKSIRKAAWR